MKAVFFEKPGGLEVLKYGELSTPKPQKGEALMRVRASGLNRLDIWLREDKENARNIPMPHISGSDAAGIIEEINGESSLKVGQEVVLNPAIPCGTCPRCKNGEACELVKIFGVKNQGSYAEYITAPISQLYPKPKNVSFAEAAAFPLTFLTAWHMLVGRANLQKGETVFVWGASGGLGSSAIQVAKHLGAKVIAAAKSEEDAKQIREIGADEIVIYTKGNVESAVKNLTNGLGVDVVFESVGEKTWSTTLAILRPFGRVVIAGTTSGDIGTQDLSDIYVRQLSIFGARMGTKEEFEQVLELVAAGKLKPIVDRVFPLQEAATAQKRMVEGKHLGKIVLATSRKKDDWETIYKNRSTPWDASEPEPYLVRMVEEKIVKPCPVLDLGCGTGNEVIYLAKNNFSATGVDISATAIEEARKKAKAEKVNCDFIVSDVLEMPLTKKYDFVLDRACFHFLDPEDRYRYIENLKTILNPSGLFLLVVSSDKETAKGPYQFSKADIKELFSDDFEIQSIELAVLETHGEKPKPYICLMRKR